MATQTFRAFTPEIWSPRINYFLKAKMGAAKFFDNYSDDVTEGGDDIWIPSVAATQHTVSNVVTTTGDVTGGNISDTKTKLTIDTWKASGYNFPDFQAAQIAKKYPLRKAYAMAMGYQLGKTFESAILSNATSITPTVGSTATRLVATNIEKAFSIAESRSVPMDESILFLSPKTYWKDVMAIAKYYDASQFGKGAPTAQGYHDLLYGVPVYLSTFLPAAAGAGVYNLLIQKSAIVYAFGNLPQVQNSFATPSGVRMSEKHGESLRVKYISDIMYGIKVLNATRGVQMLSSSR